MRAILLIALGAAGFTAGLLWPTARDSRTRLTDACLARQKAESCDKLGTLLVRGDLDPTYREEPGLYFGLACEDGLLPSCDKAQPWAKAYFDYEVFETDIGCMLRNNPFACEETANGLREEGEEGAPPDAEEAALALARSRVRRALGLYREACANNDADSCMGASRIYGGGFGVEWNQIAADRYASRACYLGLTTACGRT